jgi:hypothetical protein
MTKSDEQDFSYTAGLKAAERDLSVLVDLLSRAEANRIVRFKALSGTACQLRALEEILTYTKELEIYFRSEEQVFQIAFLLRRVYGGFATAIEALLSGFHKTVLDSMRDVMEIEFLFRDFTLHHGHISEWLTASEKLRRNKFQAGSLRQRYAASMGQAPGDMREATDYRGHSMLLHVLPYENPIVWATPSDARDAIGSPVCLYDIVEHAHRLFGAVNGFCDSFKLSYPDAKEFLKSAAAVWEECQKHWDRVAPILGGSDAKALS